MANISLHSPHVKHTDKHFEQTNICMLTKSDGNSIDSLINLISPINSGENSSYGSMGQVDEFEKLSLSNNKNIGGAKTIGFFGGFNLLCNNICGPAIVLLPSLFQSSGIIATSIALIVITFLAFICSFMMVESMKLVPGNQYLRFRYEYMNVVDVYLSRIHYWIIFVFYQLSLLSALISYIIQTSQIFDIAIATMSGCSYGFIYYPYFGTIECGNDINNVEPWKNNEFVISIGFIVVTIISIPFGILNLENNIILQWIATIGLTVIVIIWIAVFFEQNSFDINNVPLFSNNQSQLIGVILFNYSFIVTLPSWANEKKLNVSTTFSLITSLGYMLIIFFIVGIFGGMAYKPYYNTDQDIFDKLNKSGLIAKITVYLTPIIQNITTIPVYCIIIRYNLLNQNWTKLSANIWSILFPWIVSLPLYNGNGFNDLCNWTGVLLTSYVNFIIPPYVFIWAYIQHQKRNNKNASIYNQKIFILACITFLIMCILSLLGIVFTF